MNPPPLPRRDLPRARLAVDVLERFRQEPLPCAEGLRHREVLERLRSDPAWRSLPIVILTTADDRQEIQRCYALGCSLYLTKPVMYQEFIETIELIGRFLLRLELPVTPVALPNPC